MKHTRTYIYIHIYIHTYGVIGQDILYTGSYLLNIVKAPSHIRWVRKADF